MILINGIPATKELVTIFSMVKGATLENPIKTKDLKRATGLSERTIRNAIQDLRFNYSVPVGSLRDGANNGYYFIRNQDDLIATIAPIRAQAKKELNVINKLKDNLKNWNDER
ncbi:HTH domain-containing protein [Lactobacillus salivarius]|uniref:HTH domain-containing protein n=1 Tax=Ligilactobacillus salivarius TaxID=1624 RepID=UPI00137128AB|nr:HTH domain-containing protein [Ligilactobacillus salivarius]MYU60411.1 HTH domain-containing protein [Ligilactobacillus salivarius]